MWPLLQKDGLNLAFLALQVIFATFCHYCGFFEPGDIVSANVKKTRASPKPLTNTDLMKTTCHGEMNSRFILFIPHLKYLKNRLI